MSDAYLDADAIRASTFVRHVEIHDTFGSTNDRAVELARDSSIKLPALVAARQQIAGRGRGQNTWWAAEGALTFSVLLEPARFGIQPANWPQFSLTTAVAVCDALACVLTPLTECTSHAAKGNSRSPALAIKWPNDVMLGDAKVCGILIESPGGAVPAKDRVIVGVGINVNNPWRGAPQEMSSRGTSLCDVTGRPHSLQDVIVRVLNALALRLAELASGNTQLPATWQRLCWLLGRRICVRDIGRTTIGRCAGLDIDGALLVATSTSTERVLSGVTELLS